MVHCIGDSHSAIFSGEEKMQPIWPQRSNDVMEGFRSYRVGPSTAYQISNKIPIINDIIEKASIGKDDRILFCFGEVDCRAHLKKQIDLQKRTLDSIVHECVDRYFTVIKHYKDLGYNVMVWGPIGSWTTNRPYNGPSFGTCEERNLITKEFNDYVKSLCDIEGINFITIFYDMVDDNNITKDTFLDDWFECHMHLSQRSMPTILDKFKEQELI